MSENMRYYVDSSGLPENFPTHLHSDEFWASLGRAIATFGFLEETLGKAIFALTATREYAESEAQRAFENWLPVLERAITNPLANLIEEYAKAIRDHNEPSGKGFVELEKDLRDAVVIRNVLCHGSWRLPSEDGSSIPLYVHKKDGVFETPIDINFLEQTQRAVRDLTCAVINTVTQMGFQFPGSGGPGKTVLQK